MDSVGCHTVADEVLIVDSSSKLWVMLREYVIQSVCGYSHTATIQNFPEFSYSQLSSVLYICLLESSLDNLPILGHL